MTKAAFNKKKNLFTSKLDLKCKEETSKILRSEHSFAWYWNFEHFGQYLKIPGKFWNAVPEKDGEDQLDRSCDKWSIA